MLGATVPTIGGIEKAFYWGDQWGCEAVQFYITLSRKWQVDKISREAVDLFKKAWRESKVKEVVAHVPYLVNLVSENKNVKARSIKRMALEIERAKLLGVRYLVLHPGSIGKQKKEVAIKILKESFDQVFSLVKPDEVKILIETMAGQGSYLGSSFQEIAEILSILDNKKNFAVCFDSSHIFASGYNISESGEYEKIFTEFKKYIPLEKINVFHLNDSKVKLNSRVDRHQHIGEGNIGLGFFRKLLNDKRFKNIPMIIETPDTQKMSEHNLQILRGLK